MKLLFIAGSLRVQSYNLQLAMAADEMFKDQAEISILDFANVPLYNADFEFPTPDSVEAVRKACLEADGIWIFTPEYNMQIPGVEKNLLDWLSRPMSQGGKISETAVFGKPVAISGCGGNNATRSVRKLLESLLPFMGMKLMKEPQTGLAMSPEEWETSVLTLDEDQKALLKDQGEKFIEFIKTKQTAK